MSAGMGFHWWRASCAAGVHWGLEGHCRSVGVDPHWWVFTWLLLGVFRLVLVCAGCGRGL